MRPLQPLSQFRLTALTDSNTERVKEKNSEIVYAKFIEMLDFSDFLKLFQSKTFA